MFECVTFGEKSWVAESILEHHLPIRAESSQRFTERTSLLPTYLNCLANLIGEPDLARQSDMVCTNLIEPPQKKAKGITINEGGSNPPKQKENDLQPGDKGKRKKHISRKGVAIEPYFDEPEDKKPLINRMYALRTRSHPIATNTPLTATPPTIDSIPA
ncbi:hypothetical protein H5410_040285 [Solanum commersonii]|uniref:Uncharacterized protein n=1 Tax=Solanum commersonii TaxID=4109 RepID=A0A9J5XNF7_SOLCO|nr:hypothetical protein H5410_040285 [Solanum commersonii]